MTNEFTSRLAQATDIDRLTGLMHAAIAELQKEFLSSEQVTASFQIMGMDSQLIADGTYFVILQGETPVGCGGWSRRQTLFGGNHTPGRVDALLDPATDAARIRAMYTHPDWKRRGIGRLILSLCEAAASGEGFRRVEMAATLSGAPLYRAAGYAPLEHFTATTAGNVTIPLIRMGKEI